MRPGEEADLGVVLDEEEEDPVLSKVWDGRCRGTPQLQEGLEHVVEQEGAQLCSRFVEVALCVCVCVCECVSVHLCVCMCVCVRV